MSLISAGSFSLDIKADVNKLNRAYFLTPGLFLTEYVLWANLVILLDNLM
jgi:hypothetical protein